MAVFVDTNILIYSVSGDPAEAAKRHVAAEVLSGGCVLSVQVLQEFYTQVTRPGRRHPLPDALAENFVRVWLRFPVVEQTLPLMLQALDLKRRHRLSYWDAAILAAAVIGGCGTLVTEDLSHGQIVAGVRIVNPFLPD